MSIDKITINEFKESSVIVNKNVRDIFIYYYKTFAKIYFLKHSDYTKIKSHQDIYNIHEIAVAYTRDYIWFDDVRKEEKNNELHRSR